MNTPSTVNLSTVHETKHALREDVEERFDLFWDANNLMKSDFKQFIADEISRAEDRAIRLGREEVANMIDDIKARERNNWINFMGNIQGEALAKGYNSRTLKYLMEKTLEHIKE